MIKYCLLVSLILMGCITPPQNSCGDGTCTDEENVYISRGLCPPCPPGAVFVPCPDHDLVLSCPEDCGSNACEKNGGYCASECPASFSISQLACDVEQKCCLYED
ncbi:hypothetical protein KKB44_01355 [Candidatus Micrarchaeota archaeon]|nr:hypothetical protein [Candidatus Micrarchaeota archaeon]